MPPRSFVDANKRSTYHIRPVSIPEEAIEEGEGVIGRQLFSNTIRCTPHCEE